jgi:hypothetical protein
MSKSKRLKKYDCSVSGNCLGECCSFNLTAAARWVGSKAILANDQRSRKPMIVALARKLIAVALREDRCGACGLQAEGQRNKSLVPVSKSQQQKRKIISFGLRWRSTRRPDTRMDTRYFGASLSMRISHHGWDPNVGSDRI